MTWLLERKLGNYSMGQKVWELMEAAEVNTDLSPLAFLKYIFTGAEQDMLLF